MGRGRRGRDDECTQNLFYVSKTILPWFILFIEKTLLQSAFVNISLDSNKHIYFLIDIVKRVLSDYVMIIQIFLDFENKSEITVG